jgi:hypothetical protein
MISALLLRKAAFGGITFHEWMNYNCTNIQTEITEPLAIALPATRLSRDDGDEPPMWQWPLYYPHEWCDGGPKTEQHPQEMWW